MRRRTVSLSFELDKMSLSWGREVIWVTDMTVVTCRAR